MKTVNNIGFLRIFFPTTSKAYNFLIRQSFTRKYLNSFQSCLFVFRSSIGVENRAGPHLSLSLIQSQKQWKALGGEMTPNSAG